MLRQFSSRINRSRFALPRRQIRPPSGDPIAAWFILRFSITRYTLRRSKAPSALICSVSSSLAVSNSAHIWSSLTKFWLARQTDYLVVASSSWRGSLRHLRRFVVPCVRTTINLRRRKAMLIKRRLKAIKLFCETNLNLCVRSLKLFLPNRLPIIKLNLNRWKKAKSLSPIACPISSWKDRMARR